MNIGEIREQLKQSGEFFELYHVTTFMGYRGNGQGNNPQVIIEILDAGPDRPDHRYRVRATDEEGRIAFGNPTSTISGAIRITDWDRLDRSL